MGKKEPIELTRIREMIKHYQRRMKLFIAQAMIFLVIAVILKREMVLGIPCLVGGMFFLVLAIINGVKAWREVS